MDEKNVEVLNKFIHAASLDILGLVLDYEEQQLFIHPLLENRIQIDNLVVLPRLVYQASSPKPLPPRAILRRYLVACIPQDLSTARVLAKLSGLYTIAITRESIRYVDEAEINLLMQVKERKFLEVLLMSFLEPLFEPKLKVSVERYLHFLGETIERAIKKDIGLIISSYSDLSKGLVIPMTTAEVILRMLGFTRRERRMILEIYPLELIQLWLST